MSNRDRKAREGVAELDERVRSLRTAYIVVALEVIGVAWLFGRKIDALEFTARQNARSIREVEEIVFHPGVLTATETMARQWHEEHPANPVLVNWKGMVRPWPIRLVESTFRFGEVDTDVRDDQER